MKSHTEHLTFNVPARMAFVNLGDTFAESGKPDDLLRKYGLTYEAIVAAARGLLQP